LVGPAQRMKSLLPLAVLQVIGQQQGHIEEDLLDFGFGDAVLSFFLALPSSQSNPV